MPRPRVKDPGPEPNWPAPPGTTKRICTGCNRWFASRGPLACPTCVNNANKPGKGTPHIKDYSGHGSE